MARSNVVVVPTKSRRRRAVLRAAGASSEVRPSEPASDLRGRQPVRITVEGHNLVAYGFRDQRVEIPRGSVSAVRLLGDRSLILFDRDRRMLLKAPGGWNRAAVGALCKRAGLPHPTWVISSDGDISESRSAPRWRRAPGYRRLRVRPRMYVPARIVLGGVAIALTGAGLGAVAALALALPGSVGAVRSLLAIAGGAAGGAAGLWLFTVGARAGRAAIRWAAASREMGSVAPWSPFYPHDVDRRRREKGLTVAMALAVPALIIWGPGVGIYALVHGGDARLGNLISGALLTLALPVLTWRLARRARPPNRADPEAQSDGNW
jgi:hypothetical protein